MSVILRLSGPLQAWPAPSRFRDRLTYAGPTLSAVLGLLGAAAGVGRGEPFPAFLTKPRLGFRHDDEGTLVRDFHTVRNVETSDYDFLPPAEAAAAARRLKSADGATKKDPVVTQRYYRAGATYIVAVSDPTGDIAAMFAVPRFGLYAGRKSCALSFPLLLCPDDGRDVETTLAEFPSTSSAEQILAVTFEPPAAHTTLRTDRRPELPTGPVGQSYGLIPRYEFWVNPPRTPSWLAAMEASDVD